MYDQNTQHDTACPAAQIDPSALNAATGETRDCGGQPQTARSGGHTEAGMAVEVARASGAPPSNTAPANCITGDDYPVLVLRSGIDRLYLSYPGDLSFSKSLELHILKEQARSVIELEQAEAVYKVPGHIFEVHSKGSGLFSYILSDNAFRISLSGMGAKQTPLAYVQIKSDWLVHRGVLDAVAELDVIIEQFGCFDEIQIQANVSRADVFVDFVCAYPFAEIPIEAWVSRAKRISTHTISRNFTGYSFGLGGDLSARLYDKTKELEESKKDYLRKLWADKGWDGEATVWRLEFQFKRSVLVEMGAGTVETLLAKISALWRYSLGSWLQLTIPNPSDSSKSRWPLHPVWESLLALEWNVPLVGIDIRAKASALPSDRYLFINGLAALTSFMAREGIRDPEEGFEAFKNAARYFHNMQSDYNGKSFTDYVLEKAAAKARQFNVAFPGVGVQ
ncbi:hypothetical protein [Methylomonas sp. 11b]|uniref:hypothetical protein n=1 Tax=Methylomonas sp. 11b TaxID=1168169 RepID=UPI00047AB2FB|nr:hypothetical protein [Methylomonas sp. 11b]